MNCNEFLTAVAQDILHKTDGHLEQLTIVFPNKRAALFLNATLTELSEKPLWSPRYVTISDLFRRLSPLQVADHIRLVIELYHIYKEVTESKESLSDFYNWGELMLADFDDVDKHMADARQVFTLIGNLHELDNTEYLSEEQRRALARFFSTFTADHNSVLRQRFLTLWNRFLTIYERYRERLLSLGIAYEGMLYRQVAENMKRHGAPQLKDRYAFIGFNQLNPVEQQMFSTLQKEQRAMFYWDYDAYFMPSPNKKLNHEAGKYIYEYMRAFPCELPQDHPVYHAFANDCNNPQASTRQLTLTASPTNDLQARYIAQWLTPERISAGRRTAIVLADESLLETVLHCLPPEVRHINITTGYPLANHPAASFVRLTISLLSWHSLTLHNVNAILRHPYAAHLSANAPRLHAQLNSQLIYYPSIDDLSTIYDDEQNAKQDETLSRFFSKCQPQDILERLIWAIELIARSVASLHDDFHSEGLFRMYQVLNRLRSTLQGHTELIPKLLPQVIQTTTIPFHGEPIEGIQIMGVLETRNLDFDHLLLLSANEGKLPAKVSDSSFIPHSVRHAHSLTTVENKVAIYSYYFHRLLTRVKDAEVVYNSSTMDNNEGEVSRFMLQLIAESGLNIKRRTLVAGQNTEHSHPTNVMKTPGMIKTLLEREYFSPSAFGKYLRCPLSFYYAYVEKIRETDDADQEEMDNRMFGLIFHKAAELVYAAAEKRPITKAFIEPLLNEKGHVTLLRYIDQAFREELFKITDSTRPTPRLGGLQVVNREIVLRFMLRLLNYDIRHTPFTIIGTEMPVRSNISVSVGGKPHSLPIGGTIDRLDCLQLPNGQQYIRVLDYKTGTPPKGTIAIGSVNDIFNTENIRSHSDYFLQALLYSGIVSKQYPDLPITPGLLYVQKASAENYSPILEIGKEGMKKGHPLTDATEVLEDFHKGLSSLAEEILNPAVDFTPTEDADRCKTCIYKQLCNA